jgi:hypothetical protein
MKTTGLLTKIKNYVKGWCWHDWEILDVKEQRYIGGWSTQYKTTYICLKCGKKYISISDNSAGISLVERDRRSKLAEQMDARRR